MASFFYDQQIRRFVIQFARIFSNWYVEDGHDTNGNIIIRRVPVMYGDMSRQAAAVINKNSASNLPGVPLISYYINNIEYDQSRTQDPYFVERVSVRQRSYNSDTREYETVQGQAYQVERMMPVPYKLSMSCDFWTSNTNQKHQLIEQIGVLFNPSMEIQSTDNFIDWTALSVVYQDGLTYTSRSVPIGQSNPIDIMSWKFYMPIWISSPTKVSKMQIIHKVINSIFKGSAISDMQDDDLLLGTRQKVTPYGYKILLIGDTLQILPANQPFFPDNDTLELPSGPDTRVYWTAVLNPYGAVKSGISMISLENPYLDDEIRGTISFDPLDDRLLKFEIDSDTLPTNTLDPIALVVDPHRSGPGIDLPLPVPGVAGPRYIVLNDMGTSIKRELRVARPVAVGDTEIVVDGLDYASEDAWYDSPVLARNQQDYSAYLPETRIVGIVREDNTILVDNPARVTLDVGDIIYTDTVNTTYAWGDLECRRNDIVEWNGLRWVVTFNQTSSEQQFVVNSSNGIQYRWGPDGTGRGGNWSKSVEGWYDQGSYSIII